jgi:hypothetical protein
LNEVIACYDGSFVPNVHFILLMDYSQPSLMFSIPNV